MFAFFIFTDQQSPCSSNSGSLSDENDTSTETENLSKKGEGSLDIKLIVDDMKSGQKVNFCVSCLFTFFEKLKWKNCNIFTDFFCFWLKRAKFLFFPRNDFPAVILNTIQLSYLVGICQSSCSYKTRKSSMAYRHCSGTIILLTLKKDFTNLNMYYVVYGQCSFQWSVL